MAGLSLLQLIDKVLKLLQFVDKLHPGHKIEDKGRAVHFILSNFCAPGTREPRNYSALRNRSGAGHRLSHRFNPIPTLLYFVSWYKFYLYYNVH